jgi:hypothetical protein
VEETISLPTEAAPVAAVGGDAAAVQTAQNPATSHEQSSVETAPPVETSAGPSAAVEHDPAPIQPPIQAVSASKYVVDDYRATVLSTNEPARLCTSVFILNLLHRIMTLTNQTLRMAMQIT